MNVEYDFFEIGKAHANDDPNEIRKIAEAYEKQYGASAKSMFDAGIKAGQDDYSRTGLDPDGVLRTDDPFDAEGYINKNGSRR